MAKIKQLDIVIFFRQFAILITAGVPILRCCDLLSQSQPNLPLQKIKLDLLSGKTLASSLKNFPTYFNQLICHLIQISEHTGRLDTMLNVVATHLEKQYQFKKRIQRALFYPALITIVGILTTLSMLIFIVPRFAELFQESQDKLPIITKSIFYLSAMLNKYWWLVFIFIILIKWMPSFTSLIHWKKLPVINRCWQLIILTRFTRNLAMTLAAGITIIDALKISAQASNDEILNKKISTIISYINSGLPLHITFQPHFPPLMTDMIKVGEETGKLQDILYKIADIYQADADQLLTQINQSLEPLIMVVLGVLIGGLVISMYLPIFNLGSTL